MSVGGREKGQVYHYVYMTDVQTYVMISWLFPVLNRLWQQTHGLSSEAALQSSSLAQMFAAAVMESWLIREVSLPPEPDSQAVPVPERLRRGQPDNMRFRVKSESLKKMKTCPFTAGCCSAWGKFAWFLLDFFLSVIFLVVFLTCFRPTVSHVKTEKQHFWITVHEFFR